MGTVKQKEVAEKFSVTRQTVRNWQKKGKLKTVKLPSGREKIIREVEECSQQKN